MHDTLSTVVDMENHGVGENAVGLKRERPGIECCCGRMSLVSMSLNFPFYEMGIIIAASLSTRLKEIAPVTLQVSAWQEVSVR